MNMDMTTTTMSGMGHTMSMDMPSQTSAAMDHGGMDHSGMDQDMGGMGMGGGCKISMLFNLNTIGACFLTEQWHITSSGMFAGSCIGVFLLGMVLEFLRRSVKEFDRYLVKQHVAKNQQAPGAPVSAEGGSVSKEPTPRAACAVIPPFRPRVWQQAIRALLHLLIFSVGYILMLLAMYFNVYIIISIFLGVFTGAFVFQWETLPIVGQQTSAAQEATVCCG
ncbi:Copper transport protein ctr4 [Tolypocladium ophioglossoides CBS 100239]|uniref:Copper transport protein n=1 Tax=Tolypocladium ophioglossoides (strain CBS 100239) TaxID=1163406 RepID=A0A0L0NAJ3_TOLOC|nr:Copper transport protein ctr4 [Tolypocladium ophioglossoides CBS 100239]